MIAGAEGRGYVSGKLDADIHSLLNSDRHACDVSGAHITRWPTHLMLAGHMRGTTL
jgi:hypothetical protein